MMRNSAKLSEAIDLALAGNWDASHRIVQDLDDETAAWIHAVLHKIEGDLGNSQYWYRRARRPSTDQNPKTELKEIRRHLEPPHSGPSGD